MYKKGGKRLVELEEARIPKKMGILDRVIRFIGYLLVLLPAALGFLYVRAFGVSVVISDAWSMVPIFDKWFSGTLPVSDLWAQHNEHRMFFPKGVELLLGVVTDYNNVAEMYLIEGCFLVTLGILLLAFIDNIDVQPSLRLFLFLPVSLLIFSLRQFRNMLFGFQINFAFVVTFGVLALFLLYVVGNRRSFRKLAFVAAMVSATVASYSISAGLLVWPAGLLQLYISPLEKLQKRSFIALWGLAGILEWVAYFIDWVKTNDSSLLYALEHPLQGMEYYLRLLGSSLFWRADSALMGGLLVICLALIGLLLIYKDGGLKGYSFWVSLLLYSLLILATITVGRSDSNQGTAPRYTTFPILTVVSVYAILVKATFERSSIIRTVSLVALSGVILLSASISYPEGIDKGRKEREDREKGAFVLSTYESQPDQALAPLDNNNSEDVRERAPILQRLGYNVFSEPRAYRYPEKRGSQG